jgi:hypothetical protein
MVTRDDTVNVNVPFGMFVSATSNLLTNEKLRDITVSVSMNGASYDSVYEINDTKYTMLHVFLPIRNGIKQISYTVVDNAGNIASKSVNVFVKGDEINVITIPNIEFSSNATDDFYNFYDFDLIAGYKSNDAINHQSGVDFAFYHNNICGYAFGTPNTTNVQDFYSLTESWNTFTNAIIARADISANDFDNINSHYEWTDIESNQHEVLNLEVNDILQFNTEGGNIGFIKILDLYSNPEGILISTKMKTTL